MGERRITLCPSKLNNPVYIKIAQKLQEASELFYNPKVSLQDLIDKLSYLEGYIEGMKETLKKENVQTLLLESEGQVH